MKVVFNYPRKFVDNETGYILGKPINYISKSDDTAIIDAIDKNTSHWDKEHNINLRKQSKIFGEAYELNYLNTEGEFAATILTPLEAYVLEDGTAERNVLLAIHTFTKKFDVKRYIDVYTDSEILHYELGSTSNKTSLNLIGIHDEKENIIKTIDILQEIIQKKALTNTNISMIIDKIVIKETNEIGEYNRPKLDIEIV